MQPMSPNDATLDGSRPIVLGRAGPGQQAAPIPTKAGEHQVMNAGAASLGGLSCKLPSLSVVGSALGVAGATRTQWKVGHPAT